MSDAVASSFYLDPAGTLQTALPPDALAEALESGKGTLWVDVDSKSDDEWALLAQLFHFHPLAIEDTRSPNCRIKVEEYRGYLFIVVRETRFATRTPAPYDLDSFNLYLFVGGNYLVTVHAEPSDSVGTVIEHLRAGPEALEGGADHLGYRVLDTLVDLYFPLIDHVDGFVDELEERIFVRPGRDVVERVFDLRRMLVMLRRQLAPTREVMSTVANRPTEYLHTETQIYLRDVYDHVVRELESVETYRDLLNGAMETHFSVISNRVNDIMKALSIVATIILPPTLIASIYGMNFDRMPFLHDSLGFWIALAAMVLISGAFMTYMWWKQWL